MAFHDARRQPPPGKKSRLEALIAGLRKVDDPGSWALEYVQALIDEGSWAQAAHAALKCLSFDEVVRVFEQEENLLTLIGELELVHGKLPTTSFWSEDARALWVRVAIVCLAKVDPSYRADEVSPRMPTRY